MAKYLKTKEGSLEQAVLEAVKNSPAQIAAIASNKKQSENNYIHAARMAKEKGEKTFTIGGKDYDVEEALKTEKLDPVGKEDGDIDNDGDKDASDKYLAKRRKTVAKAIKKDKKEGVKLTEADGSFKIVVNGIRNLEKADDRLLDDMDFNIQAYIEDKGAELEGEGEYKGNSVELFGEDSDMKIVQKWCKDQSQLAKATQRMIKPNMDYADLYEERADHLYVAALLVGEAKSNKAPAYAVKFLEESTLIEGYSPKEIKMAIGVASDKRYAGGNMTGAVSAIEKIKKGLSNHPQVMAVLKRQNESLVDKAARHITNMWKEAAAAKDRTEADEKCEDCGKVHEGACSESKDNSTMTGKTAAKVEVNPSENKAK